MKRMVTAAAIVAVMVNGCGNASDHGSQDTGSPADKPSGAPATRVTADGVYKVGVDIASGVYTTPGTGCVGFTASNADFKIEDSANPDAYLAESIRVGDVQRIVVHEGEFFTSMQCDEWRREDAGEPKSTDPAALAGGCDILVGGDDLVQQVVAFLRKPIAAQDSASATALQERLMAPVEARNGLLGDPAGQLVDSLDNPSEYVTADGDLDAAVARAIAKIRNTCGRS